VDDVIRPASPPQLITTSAKELDHLAVVCGLAKVLDTAFVIPGTRIRVGLDSILGLLPGIGDAIGMALGGYIVLVAARLGVPRPVIARMLLNLGTDAVVGAVPVVGDVFDVAWKAHAKNVALLEQAVAQPKEARRSSVKLLVGIGLGLVALVAGTVVLTMWLVRLVTG
jgi:hypothetical protein